MKNTDCLCGLACVTGLFLALSLEPGIVSAAPVGDMKLSLQQHVDAGRLSSDIKKRVDQDGQAELLVVFDGSDVQAMAEQMRASGRLANDSAGIIREKARNYARKKSTVLADIPPEDITLHRDYSHFPIMHVTANQRALTRLLNSSGVVVVTENRAVLPALAESLPLIGALQAQSAGATGSGTAVAILDTGLDYAKKYAFTAFGNCTAPGTPSTCKVAYVQDFAPDDGKLDANGHGTNVAGIVSGVAPDTKLIGLDVFNGSSAYYSDILTALDWVLTNRDTYNIVAVNMSLGSGYYSAPCPYDGLATAVDDLKSAGIATVIASGNDKYTSAIAAPACIPSAISVGAVYDSNIGAVTWTSCTDTQTAADKVACFSNSASFLTMLAPGAYIYAAGATYGGTSQASPHVAGAVAVMKGRYPNLTVDNIVSRLTGTGVSVNDSRNSIVKPRLSLYSALLFPSITANPLVYDFGNVPVDSTSPAKSFTITNAGMANLTISTAVVVPAVGTSSYDFGIQDDSCSGQTLTPAASCTVGIAMMPQTVGSKGASLALSSTDPFVPELNISLSGSGQFVCANQPVRIAGATPVYYGSIQTAYESAATGAVLQLHRIEFAGDLTFARDVDVAVTGGYDCEYADNSSSTEIAGKLVIRNGTIGIDKVRVR